MNIFLSIILARYIGITGIFIATSISRLCTTTWLDAYLVHKYEFKTPVIKFLKKYVFYLVIFIINFILCNYLSSLIMYNELTNFILNFIIVMLVPNIIMIIIFHNTDEFIGIKGKLFSLFTTFKNQMAQ